MSVAFLANIGSRDVAVDLPDMPTAPRPLGETLMQQPWRAWQGTITLPYLAKALDWLDRVEGGLDRVILFATDQRDPAAKHLDTEPLAQVVREYITRMDNGISRKMIDIILIKDNPFDYDSMIEFYIPRLSGLVTYDRIYLEVTGGAPAMSFALLWKGVELLQEKACTIFVTQERSVPLSLNIGHKLRFEAMADDFQDMIKVHQYHAALNILESNRDLMARTWMYFDPIQALTLHARQRLNFNFEEAQRTLWGVEQRLEPRQARIVLDLVDELSKRDHHWLLREEILAAEIDMRRGAYKDALFNIHAFLEGALRAYIIKLGGALQGGGIDPDWLRSDPGLAQFLRQNTIPTNRFLDRGALSQVVYFLAKKYSDDPAFQFLDQIKKMDPLMELRNSAIHNHAGVSEEQLYRSYGGRDILPALYEIYMQVTDEAPDENSYDVVNKLIIDLTKLKLD